MLPVVAGLVVAGDVPLFVLLFVPEVLLFVPDVLFVPEVPEVLFVLPATVLLCGCDMEVEVSSVEVLPVVWRVLSQAVASKVIPAAMIKLYIFIKGSFMC